jgi:diaminopimelate decarboxylase
VLYASKALSCKALYKIVNSEGLGADVVSGGELYTALSAGMPADKIYFHGNNKTEKELVYALSNGIGAIVADSLDEIDFLDGICKGLGKKTRVLLRVNPGVEAHTHHYIQTAKPDSKFGLSVANGAALEGVKRIIEKEYLYFGGLHAHIGSQIFEIKSFTIAVQTLFDFISKIKTETDKDVKELNLGGGFGIWYSEGDRKASVSDYKGFIKVISDAVKENAERTGTVKPRIVLEPGRAIVGEAGITLYTVGNTKEIRDLRKYISIDGGMFDNPRYALYQAKYSAVLANRANEEPTEKVTIAGKCCESGDLIAVDIMMPPANRGDILAVFSTGAYNYSMASNYNRKRRTPYSALPRQKGGLHRTPADL